MANSVQIVPGNLTAFCDSDGEWNTNCLESRCVCKEDMENTRGVCTGLEKKIRKSFSLKLGNKGNITLNVLVVIYVSIVLPAFSSIVYW